MSGQVVCEYGGSCRRQNCWYIHPLLALSEHTDHHSSVVEVISTAKSKTDFGPEFPRAPEASTASKNTHNKALPDKQLSKFQQKENLVIKNHKDIIEQLIGQIETEELCASENTEFIRSTIEALQSKHEQLQAQLETYESVTKRINNNIRKEFRDEQMERELYRLKSKLPALAKRQELDKFLASGGTNGRFLIIQGQTGSGKSTQIPQYVADNPKFTYKKVICTQPRKIAAISLANRVAFEYAAGTQEYQVGASVGYRVAGDSRAGWDTQIEYVTESVMMSWILQRRAAKSKKDPFKDVGCIIIDEAHERSVTCDLLLGSFKKDDPRWTDILFIVSSATIDLNMFSKFFQNASTIEIEGRTFPVKIFYRPQPIESELQNVVAAAVKQATAIHESCEEAAGDILCFLPSQESVLNAVEYFAREVQRLNLPTENNGLERRLLDTKVLPLFGKQDPEAQAEVFAPVPETTRKVIFSTDLAETSVTIDGVVYVIDSGLKKDMVYDPNRRISSLKLQTISRSSATQRAGRSGRTQPGNCYRLYSEDEFETMEISAVPEVLRKPLPLAVLTLRDMGIDPHQFDWISQPSMEAMATAEEELVLLSALDKEKNLTDLGRLISQVQQEPSLVRMIYFACSRGFGEAAVKIAAVLSVSNIFFWRGKDGDAKNAATEARKQFLLPEGDLVSMYRVFDTWLGVVNQQKNWKSKRVAGADWCRKNFINNKALGIADSTVQELKAHFKKTNAWTAKKQTELPTNNDLQRIIFAGFFQNVSCIYKSKSRGTEFYSLQTDVIGKLPFESAIAVTATRDQVNPEWIVYDKLLRLSVTLLTTSTTIALEWLAEENPEFASICLSKYDTLPVSFSKTYSPDTLRRLFGKFFCNLERLETDLQCSIEGQIDSGTVTVFCDPQSKTSIEPSLASKITEIVDGFRKEVSEEEYLGGVRVIVGEGYQVKEVLFPMEYSKIYIRNLPPLMTKEQLRNLLETSCGEPFALQSCDLLTQQRGLLCIARFNSKHQAKKAVEQLTGQVVCGCKLAINPGGTQRGGITTEVSGRLKLSWAAASTEHKAKLCFKLAEDANRFIENVSVFLGGASILAVHGNPKAIISNQNLFQQQNARKPLPPLKVLRIPKGTPKLRKGAYFRFDKDALELLPEDIISGFDFCVTVKDLPGSMDEIEILQALGHFDVKYVNVLRTRNRNDEGQQVASEAENVVQERLDKVCSLTNHITKDMRRMPFEEKGPTRKGFYICFTQVSALRQAYVDILGSPEWKAFWQPFGQPLRIEMDYTFTASIHADLYRFVRRELESLECDTKKKKVHVTKTEPKEGSTSKFYIFRFRSSTTGVFKEIQDQLDKITSFTKVAGEDASLLFSWTGREQIKKLGSEAFLHLNVKKQEILVYGPEIVQKLYEAKLKRIIDQLEPLEYLDFPVNLNRKKIDVRKQKDADKISNICRKVGIQFHHFAANKVFVTGSLESVQQLQKELERAQLSFTIRERRHLTGAEEPECQLCFCPPEKNVLVATSCQHVFCMECIQPLFDQLRVPLTCPAVHEIPMPLVLVDISKAPRTSLAKVLELAIMKFQEENEDIVKMCPKPACNQLLSADSTTKGPFGGEFIFCDVCVNSYCLLCSKKLDKPILMHEDLSCEETQSGSSGKAQVIVREIREKILNLSCPKCKMVFLDFNGCAAVYCKCGCGFCGFCLEDCGTDAHGHVRRCSLNPSPGGYFASQSALNKAQSQMRTEKLKRFLEENVSDPDIFAVVIRTLGKDLLDLGMDPNAFRCTVSSPQASIEQHVKKVQDTILNLYCPRCKMVFADFENCAAVTCQYCKCGFCGFCLQDCGEDAHEHLATCPFGNDMDLKEGQNKARTVKLNKYLEENAIDDETRTKIVEKLEKDLVDLGMDPACFRGNRPHGPLHPAVQVNHRVQPARPNQELDDLLLLQARERARRAQENVMWLQMLDRAQEFEHARRLQQQQENQRQLQFQQRLENPRVQPRQDGRLAEALRPENQERIRRENQERLRRQQRRDNQCALL